MLQRRGHFRYRRKWQAQASISGEVGEVANLWFEKFR
jgi:hypothetical protein